MRYDLQKQLWQTVRRNMQIGGNSAVRVILMKIRKWKCHDRADNLCTNKAENSLKNNRQYDKYIK